MSIVLIGSTGAGKSTVGNILKSYTGYDVYEVGYEVKRMFLEHVRADAGVGNNYFLTDIYKGKSKDFFTAMRLKYVEDVVKKNGKNHFIKQIILSADDTNNMIIIGPRTKNEIETIKEKIDKPFFVGLKCENDRILKRFVNREYEFMDTDSAKKIYEKRKMIESTWGVENSFDECDMVINTDILLPEQVALQILQKYIEFRQEGKKDENGIIYKKR